MGHSLFYKLLKELMFVLPLPLVVSPRLPGHFPFEGMNDENEPRDLSLKSRSSELYNGDELFQHHVALSGIGQGGPATCYSPHFRRTPSRVTGQRAHRAQGSAHRITSPAKKGSQKNEAL